MRHVQKAVFGGLLVVTALAAVQVHAAARLDPRRMPPTTQPRASKFPLPPAFAVLSQRSLFSRSGVAANSPDSTPPKPEAAMALRGIAMGDNSLEAFIEDTISHRTLMLHAGDGVASGRIRSLNLDELAYDSPAGLTHVRVGQNFLGAMVPPIVPPPPKAPAGSPPDQVPPSGTGPQGMPTPMRSKGGPVAMAAPTPG